MDEAGRDQLRMGQKWYQDWRWIAAVAALFFSFAATAFALNSIVTGKEVVDQTEILEKIEVVASQNMDELLQLEQNQNGIQELLKFVREAQGEGVVSREEIQSFFQLLCASTDPLRNEACDELEQFRQEQGGP